jgi:beta-glucanase (GH16 family)
MITFKDWAIRSWLELKSNIRYIFNITKVGKFTIPSDYKPKFDDDFLVFSYSEKWDDQDHQGLPPYHPAFLETWYDPLLIAQTNEGISFGAMVKPKYFPEIDTTIPNASCSVRSKDSWKYGIFVFSAKLNSGTYLWPALWLTGRYNWPPEIDLLEAYSDDTIDFSNNKNLFSTVHFKNNKGEHISNGSRTHRLANEVTKEFVNYVIWWEKDFIKLYYNGYLVRYITDKRVLDGQFEDQRIIIGTGIQTGFFENNLTPIVVNKVAVYQKN